MVSLLGIPSPSPAEGSSQVAGDCCVKATVLFLLGVAAGALGDVTVGASVWLAMSLALSLRSVPNRNRMNKFCEKMFLMWPIKTYKASQARQPHSRALKFPTPGGQGHGRET